jgi:hypothetical protein
LAFGLAAKTSGAARNLRNSVRMTDETDKAIERKRSRSTFTLTVIILAVIALIATIGSVSWLLRNRESNEIPINISEAVNFPIFFPEPLPDGYKLQKDSVKLQSKNVFFALENRNNQIVVSEQAAPATPPDLLALTEAGFSKINTPLGLAIQGINKDKPVAILLTNTTLINAAGTPTTPSDAVTSVITRLKSLPQK